MAEVLGFRGVRFNPAVVDDFDRVICPPYDVIGPELQEELYRRSPYNVVRLEFGKVLPGDDEEENRYTRARRTLIEWLRKKVLIRDREMSVYYTEEDYRGEFGEPLTRRGYYAKVRLEDPDSGLYFPHERTLAGPKADRLRLMEAVRANLSPIFSLYDDPQMVVLRDLEAMAKGKPPLIRVHTDEGVEIRLWRVTEPRLVGEVTRRMADKVFVIADGHHRYETALRYRDLMRERHPGYTGNEPWNYVMMYFSNLSSPGLAVFPTHRAVFGVPPDRIENLERQLEEFFEVEPVADAETLSARLRDLRGRAHAFGLVAKGEPRFRLLVLRDDGVMHRMLRGRVPKVVQTLDVTILHSLILERILGIDRKAQEEQRNLRYVKGTGELVRQVVEDPEIQLGFVMNPTRVEEVKEVALAGERMPQKSTYFFPKQVTGLVMHLLFDPAEVLPGG
ncbi:DUF1015 domain-containing protein [Deferrisoma camini]|uniref:DUF1015 domain-containing protein n=1 Tax=Deferrisoma camini TaxID=1035120 RepID=UPI00046D5F53|nr:DUF1015 domain-containing protein [Deferrisoma camini]